MSIPVVIQMQPCENGAAALAMMLGYFKKYVKIATIREQLTITRNGSSPEHLLEAANYYGLDGSIIHPKIDDLLKSDLPLLIQWKKRYYCIISKINLSIVTIVDPARGEYKITVDKLKSLYTGNAIYLKPSKDFVCEGSPESSLDILSRRLKENHSVLIKIFILSLLGSLGSVFSLSPKKDFIDEVMKNGRMDLYSKLLFAMIIFFLFHIVISAVKTQIITKESRKSAAISGAVVYKKMLSLPSSFFEQSSAGDIIQRLENNIGLNHSILKSVVPKIIDVVMVFVYIWLMFSLNKKLGLICVFVEILYVIFSYFAQEKLSIANKSFTASTSNFSSSTLNGLDMIEMIKSNGMEQNYFNTWKDAQDEFYVSSNNTNRINALLQVYNGLNGVFEKTVLLFAGAYFIITGNFTIGMMSVFESAMLNINNSLSNCISGFGTLFSLKTNIERVDDILDRESDLSVPYNSDDEMGKLDGSLEIKHVSYRYNNGDDNAVDDVSFSVKPGEIVAIVGSSGCGKSTLLKMISGYYSPTKGEVLYDGKQRKEIPDIVFHASISNVDQETMVFADTVKNNIQLWDHTIEDYEIILASRDAHIHDRIMQDKDQYYMVMQEKGRNFSGGERQRLELAKALAQTPVVLCLDEFTSALDAKTEDEIFKSIKDAGITCIIVAHRLSTITSCDYIYVMDKGRIVQKGKHEDLIKVDGPYANLLKVE